MTPVDDLHVNQWVTIVDQREEEPSPFDFFGSSRRNLVSGQPLQIVAISLPFIAVTDGMRRLPIDVREVNLRVLHKKYVESMRSSRIEQNTNQQCVAPEPAKENTGPVGIFGQCPVCGDRLVKRIREGSREWILAYRQCGFEGNFGKDGAS